MLNFESLIRYSIAAALFLLFLSARADGQTAGCTDPLAVNYNPAAEKNDGTCVYNPSVINPVSSYILSSDIPETSGLVCWNNFLWTHNDNLDLNLYVLDTVNGSIVNTYLLNGIENRDWEEISQDKDYLYIGDFGNNSGNRSDLRIYRIDKSSLLEGSPSIDSIEFSYSDQTDYGADMNGTDFDCEAFIVSGDSIYLFTKQWISQGTKVYSLPKEPGICIAKPVSSYNVEGLITGATCIESKNLIVLTGYSDKLNPFLFLLYDFTDHDFFSGNKRKISVQLPLHQTEGIATTDGINYFISNENFTPNPLVSINQKLHKFDLSSFLGNYLKPEGPKPDTENNFIVSPVPAHDFIKIQSYLNILPCDYFLINLQGRKMAQGKITSEYMTLNVASLDPGLYILKIGSEKKNTFKVIKE